MDEVHNLVKPSDEILRNPRRMQLLRNVRQMLRTAQNSVVVGFTGTPLSDRTEDARALLDIIKGPGASELCDEGFVSFYMDTPAAVFPAVYPLGVPRGLPEAIIRSVTLRNFSKLPTPNAYRGWDEHARLLFRKQQREHCHRGNRAEYETKVRESRERRAFAPLDESWCLQELLRLSRHCCVAQTPYCAREDVARLVAGAPGRLLKATFPEAAHSSKDQRRRALGYATKIQCAARDVERIIRRSPGEKVLVIIHRASGYKLLLRLLARSLGLAQLRGFPAARTMADKRDEALLPYLGEPHDDSLGRRCPCALCRFNDPTSPITCIVADAKEVSEGVSFLHVRRLLLVDVPPEPAEFLQRVGRAVRFMGHAGLPSKEDWTVRVQMYQATLPKPSPLSGQPMPSPTADELLVRRLRRKLEEYHASQSGIADKAFDAGMWHEDPPPPPQQQQQAAAGPAASAADGGVGGTDPSRASAEEVLSEEGEASAREEDHKEEEPPPPPPPPPPRAKKSRPGHRPPPGYTGGHRPGYNGGHNAGAGPQYQPPPRSSYAPPPPPPPPPPHPPPRPPPTNAPDATPPPPTGPPGSPEEAIGRILRASANAALRSAYLKLCEMLQMQDGTLPAAFKNPWRRMCCRIHPDKCTHARASDATKVLNSTYDEVMKFSP